MKKIRNWNLIGVLVFCFFTLMLGGVIAVGDPVVESIILSPDAPAPGSTITFTAKVTGDVSMVYMNVKECKDDFCYIPKHNVSMVEIAPGEYQVNVKLNHASANNIGYWLVINSDGDWYDYIDEITELDLVVTSDGQQGDDGEDTINIPGFEVIFILFSIMIIILLFKRKR